MYRIYKIAETIKVERVVLNALAAPRAGSKVNPRHRCIRREVVRLRRFFRIAFREVDSPSGSVLTDVNASIPVINICSARRSFLSNNLMNDSLQNLSSSPDRPGMPTAPHRRISDPDDGDRVAAAKLPVKRDATLRLVIIY
jgi:hypothetical protein